MSLVHPLYAVLAQAERAWSDSGDQAQSRADQLMLILHAHGVIEGTQDSGVIVLSKDQHDAWMKRYRLSPSS